MSCCTHDGSSTGGFASSRTRRVRPGKVCTLQIPAWFQLSGHLRRARGRAGRGWRDGERLSRGRVCNVAVCARRTVGDGWAAGGGPFAVRCGRPCGVGRGAWGVGWGSNGERHPLIPHKCVTSPSSSGATGTNLTRLVTAVCSSGSRLMLMLLGGLVTAPSGLELEAKMSISLAGSDLPAPSALELSMSLVACGLCGARAEMPKRPGQVTGRVALKGV